MEQNILYSMGKEGDSNLVSILSKSLEPVVDMHNNDRVICSCGGTCSFDSGAAKITTGQNTQYINVLK